MIVGEFTDFWKNFEKYFGPRAFPAKCRIFLDCCREYRRSLMTCDKYGYLRFDRLSRDERAKYITLGRLLEFARKVNDPSRAKEVGDKLSFQRLFADFTGRDALDLQTADREALAAFATRNQRVFVKPRDGTCGVGCSIEDCSTDDARSAFLAKFGGSNFVAEEIIVQHEGLAALNPRGVNPIRLTTFLCRDGRVEFPAGIALVKIGVDDTPAVNLARGGLLAPIDLKSGKICYGGVDAFGASATRHPVTDVPFVGHEIPCWEKLVETAVKLAHVVPEVPFVGWDLTVDVKGRVVVIEANTTPDLICAQRWTGGLQPRLDDLVMSREGLGV